MEELLEAGVHFGHQTRRWNPKMKKYIYDARNDIHIIDLKQTVEKINEAYEFLKNLATNGQHILFVGTKKQAQDAIQEAAERCGMYYVNQRWLGGMLTNYQTIMGRVERLKELERQKEEGFFERLPKKEAKKLQEELEKLRAIFNGIKEMPGLPSAVFIVDLKKDEICFKEAKKLGIPVIAIVDTNCDPEEVDFPIPGNDDAIRAIKLISDKVAEAIIAGKQSREVPKEEVPTAALAEQIPEEGETSSVAVAETQEQTPKGEERPDEN